MVTKISVLAAYFLVMLVIGWYTRTHWKSSPASYFLADRKLGTVILLATMTATNFSAFTVFGVSGAGYRDGWSFFPIMGFGTGFMALSFWVIGRKAWRIGRERGTITPSELVNSLYGSPALSSLFALVMIVFTVPYLALQPMAAGYALEELVGLPYFYGSVLVTAIIVLYTLHGGMRAVAWTDLFQGLLMMALLIVAIVITASHHGGFAAANGDVMAMKPELFSRPGGMAQYLPGVWFSYMALWFFCDPMFPQLFQRFFAARDERALGRMMLFYPVVCTIVFFAPVAVGVLGHLSFPGLIGKQADRILPMVAAAVGGDFFAAIVIAAGLAALMSTMDSQLLTLSSIFTRDILPLLRRNQTATSLPGRLFVIGLSLAGLCIAFRPPATILQIATAAFTGLAVLFPTVFFGLYCKRAHAAAAILSILCGEATLLVFHLEWVSPGGFLPVIWVMLVAFGVYLTVHVLMSARRGHRPIGLPGWLTDRYVLVQVAIFLLAMDFWAWGTSRPFFFGVPLWIAYFVLLSALQTAAMACMLRRDLRQQEDQGVTPCTFLDLRDERNR
ncbi:MAG TPA: sodium:solute symporter family protein [Desulfobacterales bacterium]|nr:sodium:solute symporter family protein [Desulfobacterales bacterium]